MARPRIALLTLVTVVRSLRAAWLLEVTFDGGRRNLARDTRPDLPLLCRFLM